MYQKLFIAGLAVLVFSSAQTLFAQSRIEKSQTQALASEVQKLVVFFDLEEKIQAELIDACADRMKDEATRLTALDRKAAAVRRDQQNPFGELQNAARYQVENLSPEMLEFVRSKVKKRLSGDANSEMSRYIDDARGMQELERQIQQLSFVHTLDNALSLTEKQEQEILSFIKRKWKEHWVTGVMGIGEIADLEEPSAFFKIDDRSLLTDGQSAFFNKYRIPVTMVEYDKLTRNALGDRTWDENEFRVLCREMLMLKIAELATKNLSEEQRKVLSMGEKVAALKVTQEWKRALDDSLKGNSDAVVHLIRFPILVQCLRQNESKTTMKKVFGDSVIERLEQDRKKKCAFYGRRLRLLVLSRLMERQTGVCLTLRQFQQLEKSIEESVKPPSDEDSLAEYQYSIFSLPDADFQQILKPFQWEMAKERIRQNRGIYEGMRKQSQENNE